MSPRVGFAGAGRMGAPMVLRMLAAGWEVAVFARRPEVATRLSKAGATIAPGLDELAGHSDVVICCVFSDDQLIEVALGEDGLVSGLRPGSVLVLHTTGTETTLHRISQAAQSRGAMVVDAPVSGTASEIECGKLTVLLGGEDAAAETVGPILATYGNPILRTGGPGSALRLKLINNLLFAAHVQLAAEAVDLGGRLGIPETALIEALTRCSGSSSALERALEAGGVHALGDLAAPFLRKDVRACLQAMEELGEDAAGLGWAASHGPFDFSASDRE